MARKRAGSIDSDESTNARAERRAKRTQFLGTRLRGRTDSSLLIPYMLFRLDPSTTDMLLNALACAEIKALRKIHFEARCRSFDDDSSTRVEQRPREFASSKKEPNRWRRGRDGAVREYFVNSRFSG